MKQQRNIRKFLGLVALVTLISKGNCSDDGDSGGYSSGRYDGGYGCNLIPSQWLRAKCECAQENRFSTSWGGKKMGDDDCVKRKIWGWQQAESMKRIDDENARSGDNVGSG